MASPGMFLRPSSMSIPMIRSGSPTSTLGGIKNMRTISIDRPGTPRPQSGSSLTEFKFKPGNSGTRLSRRDFLSANSMSHSCSSGGSLLLSPSSGSMIRDISPIPPAIIRMFSGSRAYSASMQNIGIEPPVYERRHVANMLTFEQVKKMEFYSKFTPSSVSLSHFLDHGSDGKGVENSFLFLRREIPVRLANIMMELELLPQELLAQPACIDILGQYSQSFSSILQFENSSNDSKAHKEFNKLLTDIRHRHQDTVPRMAEALHNLRDSGNLHVNCKDRLNQAIQYFLDRLYMSRISIHLLISQHKALYCPEESKTTTMGSTGTIDPQCDAVKVAEMAFESATFICEQMYMDAPKLNIKWSDVTDEEKTSVNFVYIPSHLYHIFFEVFKNSMRATMEFHENSDSIPEVDVHVIKSAKDISIKVSDQGGGISRSVSDNIFLYLYTSASRVKLDGGDMGGTTSTSTPMHGLGYGLPLSRLYARYFGGDIKVASCDGYGTDTYIYLKTLESDARENLPIFNASSSNKIRDTKKQVEDWTKDD